MPVFSPVFGSMKSPSLAKAITEATAPEFCVEVGRTRSKGLTLRRAVTHAFGRTGALGAQGTGSPRNRMAGNFPTPAGRPTCWIAVLCGGLCTVLRLVTLLG